MSRVPPCMTRGGGGATQAWLFVVMCVVWCVSEASEMKVWSVMVCVGEGGCSGVCQSDSRLGQGSSCLQQHTPAAPEGGTLHALGTTATMRNK